MSNNAKTTTLTIDAPPALTPKLRFPEFRGAAEWEKRSLGQICHRITNGKANAQDHEEGGEYPLFDRSAVIKRSSKFKFDGEAVILPGEGMQFVPKFFSGKFNLHQRAYALMDHQGDARFVYHSLNYYQESLAKRAVKSTVLSLRLPIVENFVIGCPTRPEQHKIADCLTSVDELIIAQTQKVNALKTHKIGLMQQLFPRPERTENGLKIPAETCPRLRFSQYQNAGEWERMTIQEMINDHLIVDHLDGNHGALYPKAEEFSQNSEGIPYISANDFLNGSVEFSRCKRLPIERARLFKKGVAKDGDVLFAHNATVGPVAKLNTTEEFIVLSTTATYFRCNAAKLSNDFLKFALSSPQFVAQYTPVMAQSTRNQVPITAQRKLHLHLPKPPEQQRIADCLTSLDDLIDVQSKKLDALKDHKEGLMQQLFPLIVVA